MRGFAFLISLCVATSIFAAELVTHRVNTGAHDLALYEKRPAQPKGAVLLIHGRTFSALPNFDLQVEGEKRSVMDALVEKGYSAYALDLPSYGASPRDKSGWITPSMAATDIAATLKWIAHRDKVKPFLLGYSMGSTHCQLVAQREPDLISGADSLWLLAQRGCSD